MSHKFKKIRNIVYITRGGVFSFLYIPHIISYLLSKHKNEIREDVELRIVQLGMSCGVIMGLLTFLHNDRYFRTLFYHRIGQLRASFFSWYRPGDKYFTISATTKIEGGFQYAHPYATVISANSIGKNFFCLHLTTLGKGDQKSKELLRPTIGDNVTLGANVMILGDIHIGNNVIVGGGSVITKSVPDNCVVVGNPARIIRKNGEKINIPL